MVHGWRPDPKLNRRDANVTLMMLAQNEVSYLAPSNDPWMPAHTQDVTISSSIWVGDFDANLLGCTDQY
jgi:hypothetical protein